MRPTLKCAPRRIGVASAAAVLLTGSCIFGGGAPTRTILVDYSPDEFTANFTDYFPSHVAVRQGDTVVFKQTWTGEPHSVTMGTLANKLGEVVKPFIKTFEEKGYAGLGQEPPAAVALDKQIPYMFGNDGRVAQNGAQPCYLDSGLPPHDPNKACTKAQQQQPAFTGRQNWYNSGYIHYAGPTGNTFRVKIAANAAPGSYFFFCNNHGPFMSGFLDVKPKGATIPSQDTLNRQAQQEIERHLALLRSDYRLAQQGRFPVPPSRVSVVQKAGVPTTNIGGRTIVRAWFAGLPHEGLDDASVIEFVPKNAHARVGEKVSWLLVSGGNQGHTISFDVPQYLPIFTIKPDGTVVRNPQLDKPTGGAPPLPPEAQSSGGGNGNGPPPKPAVIDGGTWDGQKFFSSGLISPGTFALYSLRFSRPGTYKFACLVHPLMVGTLVVTP